MIKSELIAKLAEENPHLYQRDVERITGESVEVPEKSVPFFKTGKELRERLNEGYNGS